MNEGADMSCNELWQNGLAQNGMAQNGLAEEDLVAWLDGELAGEEAARVKAHLAGCAPCRKLAAALRESGAMLERLPGISPDAGFEARVVAATKLKAAETVPRGKLHLLRRRIVAAAVLVVGIAGGFAWREVRAARDEDAIVQDLAVLSNLDALQSTDAVELAQLVDDLDVLDALGADDPEKDG